MKVSHNVQGNDWETRAGRGIVLAVVVSVLFVWAPLAVWLVQR